MKSNFAEHLLNSKHKFTKLEDNLSILNIEKNRDKLNVKEELNIYLNYKINPSNMLNTTLPKQNHPIFDRISRLREKKS